MKPYNRRCLIDLFSEEKEETTFIVPEEYKKEDPHTLALVIECAPGVNRDLLNKKIVVESHMIEKIKVDGKEYNLIGESYIVGIFR